MTEHCITHHVIFTSVLNETATPMNPPGGAGWQLRQVLPAPAPGGGAHILAVVLAVWERPEPGEAPG